MKYLITPTLLNSWQYYINYEGDKEESVKQSFLDNLNRMIIPPTEAMQKGIDFERHVKLTTEGKTDFIFGKDQKYADCVKEIADIVSGGAWQVKVYKDITIDGIIYFLYGKIDVLKGAYAYDIKYSETYDTGKFLSSAQHNLYIKCSGVPNFAYLISDGKNVWQEEYQKTDVRPIENIIAEFINWLPDEWQQIYFSKWLSKENAA